ncbi:MAG: GAF domain-containing protein [Candidatus Aminicenantes bacterium]|nr:GAF domain-containing protein [Candidatus Aminicenantes bacterium]
MVIFKPVPQNLKKKIMKDKKNKKDDEIKHLKDRIKELEKLETERQRTDKKIKHLNKILRAIRNVNQLIIREKDRDALIQKACEILIETRGYYNAWIVLLDEKGKYLTYAKTGLDKAFAPMKKLLEQEKWTECGKRALKQKELIITEDPKKECPDCPLSSAYAERGGYTVCLAHHDRIYGLLSVSIPKSFIKDKQEQELLREVAGDIALALHTIELEEEGALAEEELEKHRNHLEKLIKERTAELEEKNKELKRFNKLFVGREFRIKELKDKVKELEKESKRKK